MPITTLLPALAGLGFVVFALLYGAGAIGRMRNAWFWPALLAVIFLSWSVIAIIVEGPLGFWHEHIRGFWSNQIWFDLLLAASVALVWLVPKARNLGMRPLPWVILVILSGSIGLMFMLARILFLEEAARRDPVAQA
ncbi:MAG: hypothetical protein AAFX39_16800 [Pseudomonadota bacterium]